MGQLFQNFTNITLPGVIMWCIGGLLIYLAIAKKMEPALLLPMGFGAILMNLPIAEEGTGVQAVIDFLFLIGIDSHELFPLLLFIGIGAMIDFEPLLTNPKLMLSARRRNSESFLRCLPQVCSVSSLKTRRPLQSSERQTVLPPFMSPACLNPIIWRQSW